MQDRCTQPPATQKMALTVQAQRETDECSPFRGFESAISRAGSLPCTVADIRINSVVVNAATLSFEDTHALFSFPYVDAFLDIDDMYLL